MSPQARQQLQSLTPQMRYAVLQRILQQQEANMHQSQGQPPNQTPQVQQGQAIGQMVPNQGPRMVLAEQPQGNWQQDQQQPSQLVPQQQQAVQQQNIRPYGPQGLPNQLNQVQVSGQFKVGLSRFDILSFVIT